MKLLIRHGTVVTTTGSMAADILCHDGRIAALLAPGEAATADEHVDASGLLVFPGFIDPHVHSRDPGLTHKGDFAHSTRGALAGGITTLLEMPNAIPPVTDERIFADRAARHSENAWVDFGLWGMALGEPNLDDVGGLFSAGAVGVKLFWGYALHKDTRTLVYNFTDEPPENLLLPPGNGDVLALFRRVAAMGGLLAAHCEDRELLQSAADELGHPVSTYDDLLTARPALAEATSIAVGAQFARATGCRFHVVHMSSKAGADVVRQAQAAGIPITAETCPHYLTLTDGDYPNIGPAMKIYPPIRTATDQDALWGGIQDGTIVSLGSDHAPHTTEEKARGFDTAPAGAVAVETIVPLMLDAMVSGRIAPERLAELLSTGTAKLYGIYPRKGAIAPGADADFTLVDPEAERVIRNEDLQALHPVSPWNGYTVRGEAVGSVLRGEVLMREGKPVDERQRGQLVRASHGAWEGDAEKYPISQLARAR